MSEKILYSAVEDNWSNADEAIEAATENALDEMSAEEIAECTSITLYRGAREEKTFEGYLSVDALIENMQEVAYEDGQEWASDYLDDVSDQQKEELKQLIVGWAKKNKIEPCWFTVEDIEKVSFLKENLT